MSNGSNVVDITGLAFWPKLFEHDRDKGSKKSEGAKFDYPEATTIQVVLEQSELKKVVSVNPDVKVRPTDNGLEVKFRRPWYNATNPAWGGAPAVKDENGDPWDVQKKIGNGSKVRVAAEVYKHKHGTGMRLMGVQVLEHVEPDLPDGPDLPF